MFVLHVWLKETNNRLSFSELAQEYEPSLVTLTQLTAFLRLFQVEKALLFSF